MAHSHEHVLDLRSRVVAILKVGLPLVALALLSTLFLMHSDDGFQGGGISFTHGDMEALGEGLSVDNPILTGTSANNDRFRFTADRVIPDAAPPTRADMTRLAGDIELARGTRINLSAPTGAFDITNQRIALTGPVLIDTSDGYHMNAETMDIDLAQGVLEARQDVETKGPIGTITSGTLRIEPKNPESDDTRLISFGNGVRLIYLPSAAPK